MRKNQAFLLSTILIFIACSMTAAQTYSTALGIRAGGTSGVTVKHFFKDQMAWEGQLGTFGNGSSLTGLVMNHGNAFSTPGLRYYAGGGAHLAIYNGRTYSVWKGRDVSYYNRDAAVFGLDGILGLEYILPDVPIGFSVDLKPFVEFGPGGNLGFSPDPSIGVKFIIH